MGNWIRKNFCFGMALVSLVLLLLLGTTNKVYAAELSEEAKISLITCSPADDLYAAFGHSAVRVQDPVLKFDKIYNYGTFNFGAPNFYFNFVKGKLAYQLSRNNYSSFVRVYKRNNRSIYEQVLRLNNEEKKAFFDFLENNYLPENRVYLYDFFFDNCSSRIRDILNEQLGERLQYKEVDTQQTFRDLLQPYLNNRPWGDWGIHLILGLPTDRIATTQEYQFLPYELMYAFDNATLDGQPLVAEKTTIFEAEEIPATWSLLQPFNIALLLLILVVLGSYCSFKRTPLRYPFDTFLFGLAGLTGFILFLMWLATDHGPTYRNLNMLWAFPLHLPIAFMLLRKKRAPMLKGYFWVTSIFMIVVVLFGRFFPQPMHWVSLLLAAVLGVRAWVIFLKEKRNQERANVLVMEE